jgi:large subunit ribosomal protein L31
MKKDIHPNLVERETVCSCGNEFKITYAAKTSDTLHIERCPKCHPFYTGKDTTVDTKGKIEKFKKKYSL